MMRTTSQLALALFMTLTPAAVLAQDQPAIDQPVQAQDPAAEQPAIDENVQAQDPAAGHPATDEPMQAQEPAVQSPDATTDSAATEQTAPPVDGQIVMQDLDSMLVSGLVGADVYAPNGEWIGDVNDLIVDTNGTVGGIVIGVGGVMGIGEKEMAFELGKVTFELTENRRTAKLVLNATPEELAAAPGFKSAFVQMLEREQEQMTTQPGQAMPDERGLVAPGEEAVPQPQQ